MIYLLAKACRRCGIEKPLGEFYTHSMMADGHLNFCKPCVKARVKKHRREDELNARWAFCGFIVIVAVFCIVHALMPSIR